MVLGSIEEELEGPWVYTTVPSSKRMEVHDKEGHMEAGSGKSNTTLENPG